MLRSGYFDSEFLGLDDYGMPQFDRAETSEFFAKLFEHLLSNGVLQLSENFEVVASSGMNLTVKPGFGVIRGEFVFSETGETVTVSTADGSYPRIDRVILKLSPQNREITLEVKKGTPAANPVPPELTRTDNDDYEIALANVLVTASTTSIVAANITDTRDDEEVCGRVRMLGYIGDGLKEIATIPSVQGTLTYTGSTLTPSFTDYDPAELTLSGDTSGNAAGAYNAIFTPKDKYKWPDGLRSSKTVVWNIQKVKMAVPTVPTNPVYDGTEKTPVLSGYDSNLMTLSGDTSATNAGSYTIVVSLTDTDNYCWSDNTTAPKSVTYAIEKAENSLQISPTSATLTYGQQTASANISYSGTGELTVANSDPDVAQGVINGSILSIQGGVKMEWDESDVTVSAPAEQNIAAKSIAVHVKNHIGTPVGDWATAPGEVIVGMVEAADRGLINLNNYWHVGDTRRVTIGAIGRTGNGNMVAQPTQQVDLVLMHDSLLDTNYELASAVTDGRTRPSFIVGQKNCLANLSPMAFAELSKTETTAYSTSVSGSFTFNFNAIYNENAVSQFEHFLNVDYYNALPEDIRDIFKQAKVPLTGAGALGSLKGDQNSSTNFLMMYSNSVKKNMYVTLPSVKEMTGVEMEKFTTTSSGSKTVGIKRDTEAYKTLYCNEDERGSLSYAEKNFSSMDYNDVADLNNQVDIVVRNNEGSQLDYYSSGNKVKYKGLTGEACEYFTRTMNGVYVINQGSSVGSKTSFMMKDMGIIDTAGGLSTYDKEANSTKYAGIAPIMFI
jgi:hypothetical protein